MTSKIKDIYILGKFPIAIAISITCIIGYILRQHSIDGTIIALSISLVFFTASSLAFNQIQERKADSLMKRTSNRPLARFSLSVKESFIYASVSLVISSILIYTFSNIICLLIAFVAIILYNGVYTPLKKQSPVALIFGSISGSLPPLIGWFVGGDYSVNANIICFMLFIFIGQIPHFIFLLIKYKEDYQRAGFQTIVSRFSKFQIKKINTIWLISFVAIGLMFPLFGLVQSWVSISIMLIISIILLLANHITAYTKTNALRLFMIFNIYFSISNILILIENINR